MKTRLLTKRFVGKGRRAHRIHAFTIVEMLVVIAVVAILAVLALPVLSRAKETARRIQCINNLKQWSLAFDSYVEDNEHYIPREGYGHDGRVRRDNWANVRAARSRDVWYNTLAEQLQQTPARKYAAADMATRARFYKDRLFHCPSAKFPTYADSDNDVYFSLAMNSKLIQEPIENPRASIKVDTIQRPSETVIFLDARVSDFERKVHTLQLNSDLGQPSAFATRFAARHQADGNLAFADSHVETLPGSQIVETRASYSCGLAIFPGGKVFWRPDPLEDPNILD